MGQKTKIQGWRKIAFATWERPRDPQFYGDMELDATAALAFIDEARRAAGVPLTVTHLVGKAVAFALAENVDLNVKLRGSNFVSRDSIDSSSLFPRRKEASCPASRSSARTERV